MGTVRQVTADLQNWQCAPIAGPDNVRTTRTRRGSLTESPMKQFLCAAVVVALLTVGVANADQITDAQVQNLQNLAQVAYDKADIADAKGNRVDAAKWRAQAHQFERQAQQLREQSQKIQDGVNAIADTLHQDN